MPPVIYPTPIFYLG